MIVIVTFASHKKPQFNTAIREEKKGNNAWLHTPKLSRIRYKSLNAMEKPRYIESILYIFQNDKIY